MDVNDICHNLWAKSDPFKPLWMHMLETGIVAQELVSKGCFYPLGQELCGYLQVDEEKMLALVGYLATVHDIGKAAGPFQAQDDKLKELLVEAGIFCDFPNFRHEDYGAYCLNKIWKTKNRFSSRRFRSRLAAVLRYHHQKILTKGALLGCRDYCKVDHPLWTEAQEKLEDNLWKYFCPSDTEPGHMDAVCTLLSGIVIAADWIASGEVFAALGVHRSWEQVVEETRHLVQGFLQDNDMQYRVFPTEIRTFMDLWPKIPREGMRPLQVMSEALMEDEEECPLAVILEAPMGEGKTEAGLFLATRLAQRWGKEGFYVALPTAATSNQMHGRVERMLQSMGLSRAKLMHGMAWIVDTDGLEGDPEFYGEAAQDALLWTAPMRRGMIAPFAVGTVDQAMMAAMRTKYGVLRLAGLAQKVLVIDEIHAYDAYMGAIIKTLLCWCRALHIPVVMLSATLPSEKKREFAECYFTADRAEDWTQKSYPAVTFLYDDKPPREIPVMGTHQKMAVRVKQEPLLEQPEGIASWVKEYMDTYGGCLGVMLNTVRGAQLAYRAIKAALGGDCKILLFHARFSAAQRNVLEQECTRLLGRDKSQRPQKLVVVATQVVEQSLDLDFDAILSDLCPIDLLLQRTGRLWRHEETVRPDGMEIPCLTVMVPADDDFKASGMVYPAVLLKRTWRAVRERQVFHLPEDIPVLVENIYTGYEIDEKDMEQWMEYQMANQMMEGEAVLQELPMPDPEQFWLEDGVGKTRDMFYSDEDTAFLPAKTRLGELSCRMAVLPRDLFYQVKACEKIFRRLAKEVLRYSVTVAERKVKFLKEGTFHGGMHPLEGKGLLYGMWILCGEDGVCRFDDGHVICMDEELGLLIDDELEWR